MKSIDKIVGIIFILVGLLFTVSNFGLVSIRMDFLWPLFILVPGLVFEYAYFSTGKASGILFPGAILTTLGVIFLFHTMTGFMFIAFLWPLFIMPVALAFLQFYFFGVKHKVFLILFFGFSALTTFFIGMQFLIYKPYMVMSAVFILIGLLIITTGSNKKNTPE